MYFACFVQVKSLEVTLLRTEFVVTSIEHHLKFALANQSAFKTIVSPSVVETTREMVINQKANRKFDKKEQFRTWNGTNHYSKRGTASPLVPE